VKLSVSGVMVAVRSIPGTYCRSNLRHCCPRAVRCPWQPA